MREALRGDELTRALEGLDGWRHEDDALVKEYDFGSFALAFSFLTGVALVAERRDHHPEIVNVYRHVRLRLSTHDAGDVVTQADVAMAEAIDALG